MTTGSGKIMVFNSEKARKIIEAQTPMDTETIDRVKEALSRKGTTLAQSDEIDEYLIRNGKEASTFTDGTIIMHTRVSASGFYEELIHYGQLKNAKVIHGSEQSRLLMEIEAQERLIKHQKAYKITDYEIELLRENLKIYQIELKELLKGGK